MRASWDQTRARLELLWREAEDQRIVPERMCLRSKDSIVSLAMCGRATRYASDTWYGVYFRGTGEKFRSRGFASGEGTKISPISAEGLAKLPESDNLSGHDKYVCSAAIRAATMRVRVQPLMRRARSYRQRTQSFHLVIQRC